MRLVSIVAAVFAFVSVAGGQQPIAISSLNIDVRSLLLQGGMSGAGGSGLSVFASAPASFPQELIPTDATALASAPSATVTSVVTQMQPDALWPNFQYVWRTQRQGWTQVDSPDLGFSGYRMPLLKLCKADQLVEMFFRRTDDGRRLIAIVLTRALEPCRTRTGWDSIRSFPIPVLDPPSGAEEQGGGGAGGGSDQLDSRTRLRTALDHGDVGRHYARLLQKVGWTLEGAPLGDERVLVMRLSALNREKAAVTAILTSVVLEPGQWIAVHLSVFRNSAIRSPLSSAPSTT